jgi:gas vesicle protein
MANTGNTLLALLTGAAIGAGVGILYAPDKGEKTRKKLKKNADKAKKEFSKKVKETTDDLSVQAKKAKATFEERLNDTLNSASHKADDIIVAMEEKLEALRKQNAKLQQENVVEKTKANAKKAVS